MKIKPLGSKIVLEAYVEEKKSKSGIVLPDTVDKEKPEQGKVVAVGPGACDKDGKNIKMNVKKSDIVLFKKYSADEFKIDGKEYLVVGEDDIIGIIE